MADDRQVTGQWHISYTAAEQPGLPGDGVTPDGQYANPEPFRVVVDAYGDTLADALDQLRQRIAKFATCETLVATAAQQAGSA